MFIIPPKISTRRFIPNIRGHDVQQNNVDTNVAFTQNRNLKIKPKKPASCMKRRDELLGFYTKLALELSGFELLISGYFWRNNIY